jgi:hypothetical protein
MNKADYVKSQPQTREHKCHWPGCTKQVPPAMWGCKRHWFSLPWNLRNKIWRAYRPGQEIDMNPSKQYLDIAEEIREWIKENY